MIGSTDLIAKATRLKRLWSERDKKFKEWYQIIRMLDRLAQKDMESFVGNDPRAAFNHLISVLNRPIPHRIRPDELALDEVAPAAELSKSLEVVWRNVTDSYRQRGLYFMRQLIGLLLATGWYSVFTVPSLDGSTVLAEVWNPVTVYPDWDDVMFECAHVWGLAGANAKRLARRNKWDVSRFGDKVTCYDYWWLDDAGKVHNAVCLDNQLVKVDTLENRFKRIPIFTSPVAGLPDMGEIETARAAKWRGDIGQSYVVTNENVYNYFNKWWTFLLQILRDYAQARTYEKSPSTTQIVKPEEWYRRGAHFKMGPQDEIGFVVPPPIPMELRSAQLDMEAMMQRGGPTWTQYGNVAQGMTAFVMSQVIASTNNTAQAFHRGLIDCISDIDNFWLDLMRTYEYKPYGMTIPDGLPDDFKVTAEYELRIPGDLAQRATSARMLNPEFSLSEERILEWDFPEIKNPMEEIAKRDAGKARQDPIFAQINLINALRQEAELLRKAKDFEAAELHEKMADLKERQIMEAGQGQVEQPRRVPGARPEAVSPPGSAPAMTTTGEGR